MMESGPMRPSFSAWLIMFKAVRVLMEPPTFSPSYFTSTWAEFSPTIRDRRTMGVCPTHSKIF